MDLSAIPNEMWSVILSNLELKDAINFYRAYPTTIDHNIYNYLPLNDRSLWKRGIAHTYHICYMCFFTLRVNLHNITKNFIDWKITYIASRHFIDVCYKHKVKPINPIKSCIYHNHDFEQIIWDEVMDLIHKTYGEIMNIILDDVVNVCTKCGGIDHKPYTKQCLFASEKYMVAYLDVIRRGEETKQNQIIEGEMREEKRRKGMLEINQTNKRKPSRQNKCKNCYKYNYSKRCIYDFCGNCCKDRNKCDGHKV